MPGRGSKLVSVLALVAALLALAGASEPACGPATPGEPTCLTRADCEGLAHDSCEGDWTCDEAVCVWVCDACPTPASLGVVSPSQLNAELAAKDFLLVNVHVPYEGEIAGTDAHLTYANVPAIAAWLGPDLAVKTVIYCKSNYMASIAGPALVALGYCNVRYLDGGMIGWKAAGYPLSP
jgi:rhodanese-related sulfurtransferase